MEEEKLYPLADQVFHRSSAGGHRSQTANRGASRKKSQRAGAEDGAWEHPRGAGEFATGGKRKSVLGW